MSAYTELPVYFVVPGVVDDPDRVSGGNVYDQRVREGLRDIGWDVRMIPIPEDSTSTTERTFADLPDGALALVDGLIAVRESESLIAHSSRLRIVVLAHMVGPSVEREREVFRAAKRVIATSQWTRAELISRDAAEPDNLVVAQPGTEPAAATVASPSGGRLLCVGVVAPHKGQDLLIGALAHLTDVDGWTCTIGNLDTAPGFVDELTQTVRVNGLTDRTTFTGVLSWKRLEAAYGRADLVVVPSRNESFGMVVAEAVAGGIPVLAARVGGIPEAMSGSGGGILVPPEDPWALEVVLRQWWESPGRRAELKTAAMQARGTAHPWSATIDVIASTLGEVARSATAVSA